MSRGTKLSAGFGAAAMLISLLSFAGQAAGATDAVAPPANHGAARLGGPHLMPMTKPGLHNTSAPSGAHLNYYNGPVLSNMKSVDVSYGPGTYISGGHPGSPAIANFTTQYLGSGVMDWLSEYDTTVSGGTNQHIGRGSLASTITITPSSANDGSTIQDSQIQAELNSQISAGFLPAPDANTSYAVFFRLGQSICMGASCSLVAGGFCAYHGTFVRGAVHVTYQVMPDLTGTTGCGNSSDLGNTTSVLSHELTETITDADVGLATVLGPPLAWYDPTNGEIGDICNAQQGTFTAAGTTWTIQKQFSNVANDCIINRAATNNFSIGANPTSISVPQGGSGSSTISTAVTSGASATVNLVVTGAPAGVTAGVNPTSVAAGSSSSLTVNVGTGVAPGNYILTVTGTEGAVSHAATVTLTVPAPGAAVTPSSGPAGTAVTVSGVGFNAGEGVKVTYKTGLASPATVVLCTTTALADGTFSCKTHIPPKAKAGPKGAHKITAKGQTSLVKPTTTFTRT